MIAKTQQIPKGYKQTEIGVIPQDWEVQSLSDAGDVLMGHSPPGNTYNTTGMGACLINGPTEFTEKHPRKIQWTTEPTRYCRASDLLLCVRGSSTGRTNVADDTYCIGRGVAAIRAKPGYSNSYFQLQVKSAINEILAATTGSTFPSIDGTSLRRLRIPFPPTLAEQEAIAEALGDADAWIESLEQLVAKKRHLKQAAMQQLLTGKTRLPGFSGEWETARFGEVASLRMNRIDPQKTGPYEFCVELENIESATGSLNGHSSAGSSSSLKSVFDEGDVLFGKLRAYLRKYWLADRSGVCSTEIWVLRPACEKLVNRFLFQLVSTDSFVLQASEAYGTHMPRSDWNVVKNYELKLPLPGEQTAIAEVLSDMDDEIDAINAKVAKARQIKQGMMQELLTGRRRLV